MDPKPDLDGSWARITNRARLDGDGPIAKGAARDQVNVPRRPMLTRLKSHDTVIRGGSILDGTGAAAFADDVRSIAV
jgi:hypothetical protein